MPDERKKRPSYPWYPGDWKRDTAVQACPPLTRFIWREMLDIMHDGEPYGHLTAGGEAIDERALAGMIPGVTLRQVTAALDQLGVRHVYSRTEAGVIYSRRMVRDEDLRNRRGEHGGESLSNPNVPRPKGEKDPPEASSKEGSKDPPKDTYDPRTRDRACRAANANAVLPSSSSGGEGGGGAGEAWQDWRELYGKHYRCEPPLEPKVIDIPKYAELARRYPDQAQRRALLVKAFTSRYPEIRKSPMCIGWLLHWTDWLEQPDPDTERKVGPHYAPAVNGDGEDWFAECQRLHGGTCNGSSGHHVQMQIDADRAKRAQEHVA